MHPITASLVLYKTEQLVFEKAIKSYFDSVPNGRLIVVDNSPSSLSSIYFGDPRVTYKHAPENLGFGPGHNFAIRQYTDSSEFHLLLNPDVEFSSGVIPSLISLLRDNPIYAAVMPAIRYPDGRPQHLCKLLPTPFDLFARRFMPAIGIIKRRNERYELAGISQHDPTEVPSISGCFLLTRTSHLQRIGGFDERYFMYMEDVDLVRRLGDIGCIVYYPSVYITHGYGKGSYRSMKLLRYHLASAVKYFNKWGWFRDETRRTRNRSAEEKLTSFTRH